MSGEFLGAYENSVNNNRVIIPAAYKKLFSPTAKQTVIITYGYNLKSVAVYPLDVWNALVEKKRNGSEKDRKLYQILRKYCVSDSLEKNGRITVPAELLESVGIDKSVVIKGEGSYISLWNPVLLEKERKSDLDFLSKNYDSLDFEL